MKMRIWGAILFMAFVTVLAGTQPGFGAGFALYEGSARGNALGGTLVGRADDASALFYNPAGITQLPGLQIMGGFTAIAPKTDVVIGGVSHESLDNIWTPPHFYTTYQFTDRMWLGLGMFSQYGLGTEFESTWPGRFNNYKAIIQSLTFNPTMAFKISDKLSLAAGVDVVWFDLELRQFIRGTNVDQTLAGDSTGYGYNLALHYKPCDYARIGISYRSQVTQEVVGDADFTPNTLFRDSGVEGSVTLPDMLFLGVTIYPMDRLSLEVGGVFTHWATFDELTILYDTPLPTGATRATSPKNWHNTWRFQFGAEYKTTDWLDLRVGYSYDEEPVPDSTVDYIVPANDRHLISFGPGFHWNNWTLDLSYTYLIIEERDVQARTTSSIFDSKFEDGHAHMFGASVGYKF
ncbi:MAG: OmpP1/FadL family transporter [Acidobacteriota bacterium]